MESPRYLGRPAAVGDLKLPFSEAVSVGQVLYLSGSIGLDGTGSLVSGGIAAETNQVLLNIRAILERNGSSMERVIRCTVMLADMAEWAAMNSVPALQHEPAGQERIRHERPGPGRPGRDRVHGPGRLIR